MNDEDALERGRKMVEQLRKMGLPENDIYNPETVEAISHEAMLMWLRGEGPNPFGDDG